MADLRVPTSATASATVTTDGVTIQGNGSGGSPIAIKQVETDATLTGAGTVASPLSVVQPGLAGFQSGAVLLTGQTCSANTLAITVVRIDSAFTFSKFRVFIQAADGAHNSDFGLYNSAGNLIANIGPQAYAATGNTTLTTLQGSQTQQRGLYAFAMTSTAGTLAIYGGASLYSLFYQSNYGSSSSGTCPASITFPTIAPINNGISFAIY